MVSRVKRFFLEIKDFSKTIDLNLPDNFKIVLDDKINIDDNLITNIKKLLKLNKLKKNIDYQNLAIYLINQYYFYKSNSFNINNFSPLDPFRY